MAMEIYGSVADLEAALGRELGPTEWLDVQQSRIDGFANDTEDHQWIHVDQQKAAAGPFGTTIAHGFLTLSLVPYFLSQLREVRGMRMGINYGLDRVRFPSPVRVGSRIRARTTMTDLQKTTDGGVQVVNRMVVEIEDVDKPACVADLVSRYYFDDATA
jgi:acyl dehydratase